MQKIKNYFVFIFLKEPYLNIYQCLLEIGTKFTENIKQLSFVNFHNQDIILQKSPSQNIVDCRIV